MKKFYLIPLMGLLLASCASEDISLTEKDEQMTNESHNTVGEASGYMKVNIVSPVSIFSRDGYTQGAGDYLDGTSEENAVNLVRFYFFDNTGSAVEVRKNPHAQDEDSYYSFIDWTPSTVDGTTGSGNQEGTVEKTLTTTLVLSLPEDGDKPTQVVAIINPTSDILGNNGNLELSELENIIENYQISNPDDPSTSLTNSNFVMSNSVYAKDGNGIIASAIGTDAISTTIEGASQNPVNIFVERVVAKVNFSITQTAVLGTQNTYTTGKLFNPIQVPETTEQKAQNVNVKILGWSLCSNPNKSYLIKQIYDGWDNLFNDINQPWNSDNYHRSFWAINPPLSKAGYDTYSWYTFSQISGTNNEVPQLGNKMDVTSVYTQENANPAKIDATDALKEQDPAAIYTESAGMAPLQKTKVIFVGQLLDESGNPLTICEFQGQQFTQEGMMTYVASLLDMWTPKNPQNLDEGYVQITASDLTLITQQAFLGKGQPTIESEAGRYNSYFVLSTHGATKTWYHLGGGEPGVYTQLQNADIPKYIDDSLGYSHAKVWNNGMTYYYFDIKHIPGALDKNGTLTSIAYYGIVRNHIYQTAVTAITGLGTPVLDPEETIIPEKPKDTATNLQTVINILSWRLVSSEYTVDW